MKIFTLPRVFGVRVPFVLVCLGLSPFSVWGYSGLLVFGDSFSDEGNLYTLCEGSRFGPPHAEGKATNGDLWLKYLADGLDLSSPGPSQFGGKNYAYGGATSDFGHRDIERCGGDGVGVKELPNVGRQIDQYLEDSGGVVAPETLVILFCGGNDFRFGHIYSIPFNIRNHITRLAESGAKHFLVFNLPPFGSFPVVGGHHARAASYVNYQTGWDFVADDYRQFFYWTESFASYVANSYISNCRNSVLSNLLDELDHSLDVNILKFDSYSFFEDVFFYPQKHGLKNIQDPAYNIYTGEVHPEVEEYMFWDFVHLTAKGHRLLGQAVLDFVRSKNRTNH